ncbi:TlpA family protein disulfide reductase [Brevibacillus porteri]|uniref:TlpA family protein disulfide reductase n=1 Tax=Brevibacillus porteri TaxID=2126350 RepID=UPI00370B919C
MHSMISTQIEENLSSLILKNHDGSEVTVKDYHSNIAIVCVSLYCVYCVDLLPHLKELSEVSSYHFIVLANGETDDHKEMIEYFGWEFPLVLMEYEQMDDIFGMNELPFVLFLNEGKIVQSGVVHKPEDFHFLLKKAG